MFKNSLVKISTAPLAVLILHIVAIIVGWYEIFWWFDIPLHLFGGAAIALSSYYLLQYYETTGQLSIKSIPLRILVIISITALVAVSWEFMEFAVDFYTKTSVHQSSLLDTMKDLANGLTGGGITAIVTTLLRKYNIKN